MTPCAFPGCGPATTTNRADQPVCAEHERVVVGSSWMDEPRKVDGGHN